MKGKAEVSETMLTEKQESQLSDTEFKALVIRKINEFTENYQKLQGHYNELTANYQQGNRNYQQGPRGNEECNFCTEKHSRMNRKQA